MQLNRPALGQIATAAVAATACGTAGVGITVLASGLALNEPGSLNGAIQGGCALAGVLLVSFRYVRLRDAEDFLALVAISFWTVLSFFYVARLAFGPLPLLRSPAPIAVCGLLAALAAVMGRTIGHRGTGRPWVALWRIGFGISASAAIGAGIGFLQGAVTEPGQPNMMQDGGALLGVVIGGLLGLAMSLRWLAKPESVLAYSLAVNARLASGLIAAYCIGMASIAVSPLVAMLIAGTARRRQLAAAKGNGSGESKSAWGNTSA